MKIGVDLGGHTLTAASVSCGGPKPRIEKIDKTDTPRSRSVREIMEAIAFAAERLSGGEKITSVGVAVPGMLNADRRRALRLPNFPAEWDDLDVVDAVETALESHGMNVPVLIENDANCYALGEGSAGEAVGVSDFVTFTMGTGIGCGIVTGGRLLTGAHGMAGEGGHVVVRGEAPCGCGGKGHSETLAAADGTSARALAKGLPEDFEKLWKMRGQAEADEVLDVTIDVMARTIATACHLLDPEIVIIGGGMSRGEGIGDALKSRSVGYLSRPFKKLLDIRISRLGSEAALYGAVSIESRGKAAGSK
ncbi:MAG: ROK family protein [Synergistaceae bacterium]|jgi:glucokinase|nr:ROK family protein [Synergistaceae bacterium]